MKILIIDDEENMRHMLSILLKKGGYEASSCADALSALKMIEKEEFAYVLCDVRMPGMTGIEFLGELNARGALPTVIMMSAYGTVETAVECMKHGAYDYISKPFKTDEVLITLMKAEERTRLKRENVRMRAEIERPYSEAYAKDDSMKDALALAAKVADYDTTVLITGETGTGKELVARAIHYNGKRKDGPFIAVNCGAIPEALMESELFGHVKGAFTDAVRNKSGLFEEAGGGTIFLDEIGELPREMQVKLLRVLQEGEIRKVGDTKAVKSDARVVAATARDLSEEIKKGSFREDLFYRLNVMPIKLPPLRERRRDIEGLTAIFIERYAKKYGKHIKGVTPEAMKELETYEWPGNVRELENVMERAVILADNDTINSSNLPLSAERGGKGFLPPTHASHGDPTLSIKKASAAVERELIKKALTITKGNKTKAAELLEISHKALLYKMKDYEL
ncbi:MAG: sigma-54 dependent transcriptional regulator [Thermodesulfobacteriota bacterium]